MALPAFFTRSAAAAPARGARLASAIDVGHAEEVGRVEHHHVEHVALDPLAAVEEPPQRRAARRRRATPSASSIAWHALIWYATGQMPQMRAVMSGASVRVAAAEQRLEEARRLEDAELRRRRPRRRRARRVSAPSPSTRARQSTRIVLVRRHGARASSRNGRRAALKRRNRRCTLARRRRPARRAAAPSGSVCGASLGPKQP